MCSTDLEETQWQFIKKILNLQERKRKYDLRDVNSCQIGLCTPVSDMLSRQNMTKCVFWGLNFVKSFNVREYREKLSFFGVEFVAFRVQRLKLRNLWKRKVTLVF